MQKDREVDRGRCALQLGFRSDILKQVVFEELIIKKKKFKEAEFIMFGRKVASTHEVIEKLQEYEKENGIGAIVSIGTHMAGDREMNTVSKLPMIQKVIVF